jgi:hypothetical protein
MRLPWLQVEQDGIAQCKRLAGLLGVPAAQGIGIGVLVWQYALEVAPEGDFRGFVPDPGILAVEVGWPEKDAANLITQLQRVGMVATTPSIRVRGLNRYVRAWEKNSGKKAIHRELGDEVPEPGTNPAPVAPEPARQTQTQTQTQKELPAAEGSRSLALVAFEIDAPDRERIESWSVEDFWRAFELSRREAGYPPEKWPRPRSLSDFWGEARAVADVEVLGVAAEAYLRDEHWMKKAKPACPWAGFAKQWSKFLPRRAAS